MLKKLGVTLAIVGAVGFAAPAAASADIVTSGAGSVLGGNQVVVPINAPINVCGNAVAVIGQSIAGCKGGAAVFTKSHH